MYYRVDDGTAIAHDGTRVEGNTCTFCADGPDIIISIRSNETGQVLGDAMLTEDETRELVARLARHLETL
jgi:hypothetical protein